MTLINTQGRYTKVGNFVHCTGTVQYPSTSDGNAASIGGLPFVTANLGGGYSMYVVGSVGTVAFRNATNTSRFLMTNGVNQDATLLNTSVSSHAIQFNLFYMTA